MLLIIQLYPFYNNNPLNKFPSIKIIFNYKTKFSISTQYSSIFSYASLFSHIILIAIRQFHCSWVPGMKKNKRIKFFFWQFIVSTASYFMSKYTRMFARYLGMRFFLIHYYLIITIGYLI